MTAYTTEKKTVRPWVNPVSSWFNKDHTAKLKCNTVHQGIYKTKTVLQNPEWVRFNDNSLFFALF